LATIGGSGEDRLQPATGRIESIDVLRGVAVLGILLLNILGFGLPESAYFNPTVDGATSGWNLLSYQLTFLFAEGSMRTVFSILFGAGVVLFTRRGNSIRVADLFYRRHALLILIGMLNAYLFLAWGDVLYLYGLAGFFLFLVRELSPRKLLGLAVVLVIVMSLVQMKNRTDLVELRAEVVAIDSAEVAGQPLSSEQLAQRDWLDEIEVEYAPAADTLAEEVAVHRAGYLANVFWNAERVLYMQTIAAYTANLWDAFAAMLLGMALFKWGFLSARRSLWCYIGTALIGYGIGLWVNGWEIESAVVAGFSVETISPLYLPTYHLGRFATASGHIGTVMLVCKLGWLRWLTRGLAAVGRLALTNYLGQSLIALFVFTGVGLAWFGSLQRYQLYGIVLVIWFFQLVTSSIWLRWFLFGPAEWLWRWSTYGKPPPMRRAAALQAEIDATGV